MPRLTSLLMAARLSRGAGSSWRLGASLGRIVGGTSDVRAMRMQDFQRVAGDGFGTDPDMVEGLKKMSADPQASAEVVQKWYETFKRDDPSRIEYVNDRDGHVYRYASSLARMTQEFVRWARDPANKNKLLNLMVMSFAGRGQRVTDETYEALVKSREEWATPLGDFTILDADELRELWNEPVKGKAFLTPSSAVELHDHNVVETDDYIIHTVLPITSDMHALEGPAKWQLIINKKTGEARFFVTGAGRHPITFMDGFNSPFAHKVFETMFKTWQLVVEDVVATNAERPPTYSEIEALVWERGGTLWRDRTLVSVLDLGSYPYRAVRLATRDLWLPSYVTVARADSTEPNLLREGDPVLTATAKRVYDNYYEFRDLPLQEGGVTLGQAMGRERSEAFVELIGTGTREEREERANALLEQLDRFERSGGKDPLGGRSPSDPVIVGPLHPGDDDEERRRREERERREREQREREQRERLERERLDRERRDRERREREQRERQRRE